MATRMQQRRGTASQWISTNSGNGPILSAGEIGYESDTNKFKIGDGTNHWINLDYFIDASSTVNPSFGTSIVFEGATADSYETTLQVTDPTADRTITLPNATGTVVLADGSGNVTVSGDLTVSGTTTTINSTTINATTGIIFEGLTADAHETTLTVTDPTADRTITFPDATGTVQLRVTDVSDTEIGYLNGVTSAIQTQMDAKAPLASPTFTGTVTLPSGTVTSTMIADGTIADADINASAAIALSKLATDPLARANHTGSQAASTISDFNEAAQDAVGTILSGDLAYNDSTPGIALNYVTVGNTLLDGVSGSSYGLIGTSTYLDVKNTNGYNKEIELDIAAVKTQLNTDGYLTTSSTSTLTNKTLTSPKINEDVAVTATATELNYVDGVTSAIQTQLDAKAPLAAPAFTGTATAVNLTISGDLTVNGTTTNINSTSLVVEDKNIVLGDAATPTDTTADGGGITLKGATDKTLNWIDATDAWTSSEDFNLVSGKVYEIAGTSVLSGSTLGSGVTGSSLTSVGTITSGTWTGTTIAIANGGTGATTASTAAAALLPAQASNSGKYLTTDGSGTLSWGTVSGYSAPTLGSTSISSGSTVTTISGLTLSGATLSGTLTAGGGAGTAGQVLKSTGSGVEWGTASAASGGAAFSELMLIGA
jgi:hypothetical protein